MGVRPVGPVAAAFTVTAAANRHRFARVNAIPRPKRLRAGVRSARQRFDDRSWTDSTRPPAASYAAPFPHRLAGPRARDRRRRADRRGRVGRDACVGGRDSRSDDDDRPAADGRSARGRRRQAVHPGGRGCDVRCHDHQHVEQRRVQHLVHAVTAERHRLRGLRRDGFPGRLPQRRPAAQQRQDGGGRAARDRARRLPAVGVPGRRRSSGDRGLHLDDSRSARTPPRSRSGRIRTSCSPDTFRATRR